MTLDLHDRRGRSGGREGRQRGRAQAAPHAPAFLRRHIPPYEMLSEEGLTAIERQADRLLEEIGFEIRGDAEAIGKFVAHGARAEGERLYFPPGLIRSIIQASAPRVFTQHARNPAHSVEI